MHARHTRRGARPRIIKQPLSLSPTRYHPDYLCCFPLFASRRRRSSVCADIRLVHIRLVLTRAWYLESSATQQSCRTLQTRPASRSLSICTTICRGAPRPDKRRRSRACTSTSPFPESHSWREVSSQACLPCCHTARRSGNRSSQLTIPRPA